MGAHFHAVGSVPLNERTKMPIVPRDRVRPPITRRSSDPIIQELRYGALPPPEGEAARVAALRAYAKRLVAEHVAETGWPRHTIAIIAAAAGGVSMTALCSDRKDRLVVRPRHVASWLMRQYSPLRSLPQIGLALGGRDHTAVMYAIRRVDQVIQHIGPCQVDCPQEWAIHLLSYPWPNSMGRKA